MCPKVKNENFFADSQGAEAERFVIYFVLKFLFFFGKKTFFYKKKNILLFTIASLNML